MTTIEGALNFRDAGGLPAGEGRRVARGRLFRSDTLQFLTPRDVDVIVSDLGLRTIIDLRLDYELEVEGRGPLADQQIAHHHLPFTVKGTEGSGDATPILQADDPMVPHYLGYLRSMPESVTGVIRVLARHDSVPAVINCAAGKDRTGVAIGMVLSVAGVSDEVIAEEYAAGADAVRAVMDRLRSMESYGDSIDRLPPEAHLTDPIYMIRFLEALEGMYGGVAGYFLHNGVTQDQLDQVRAVLTEPA